MLFSVAESFSSHLQGSGFLGGSCGRYELDDILFYFIG